MKIMQSSAASNGGKIGSFRERRHLGGTEPIQGAPPHTDASMMPPDVVRRPFEEIDHTADLCLRVCGSNLKDLFVHAARGMFALMQCEPGGRAGRVSHHILLTAHDLEALLVDWLNELLYLAEAYQELYDVYDMEHLGETRLEALVHGATDHSPQRGIKAATFSDLHVTHSSVGYQATITFDV